MLIDKIDHRTVRSAIELASHAPSVHNSQPWHWTLGRRVVHLNADLKRWLSATDADGRDLGVSCGAALHHLRVALAAADLHTTVHRTPNPAEPDRLATLELKPGRTTAADLELAAAITKRRTDRRPFSDWQIPLDSQRRLEDAAVAQGAILRMVPAGGPRAGEIVHARMTFREEIVFEALDAADRLSGETTHLCELPADWSRLAADAFANCVLDPARQRRLELRGQLRERLDLSPRPLESRLNVTLRGAPFRGLFEPLLCPCHCRFVHGQGR
jgi:hypothetical protein